MSLNTSGFAEYSPGKFGSADLYGHADYYRDKAAGRSDYDILQSINADTSRMGNGGTGGELYQQIMRNARPPSNSGGGGGGGGGTYGREGFKKAYGEEFQNNLNQATQGYRPDESKMGNFEGTSEDFQRGATQETAIRDNDPFGDSWNSIDFFGKYLTMGREAQKGRGDGTAIANKYIFNAAQTNPVNVKALDQQIRTNPLYSEAKATLAKKNTFGDQYAAGSPNWVNPSGPSAYEPPDLQGIASKYSDRIEDISL